MLYTWYETLFFFFIYSFIGWSIEATVYSVTNRRFMNRGFLTLPLITSYGVTFVFLIILMPTLGKNMALQFLMALVISSVTESIYNFNIHKLGPEIQWAEQRNLFGGSVKNVTASLIVAAACFTSYLVLHPLLLALEMLIPRFVLIVAVLIVLGIMIVDFTSVVIAIHKGGTEKYERLSETSTEAKLAEKISSVIWRRLQSAYPGIQEGKKGDEIYVFAKGLGFDKLVWVFFLCALLGDFIETVYCGLVDGEWMNRSSVLYGPFSFVWGIGAVVLTITLLPISKKSDRWIFLAGFLIGGAYEYMCSVFTEIVFGKVFWDYSNMPLNIGGRTNVLFMFFWGILAVVWVKLAYPKLEKIIERVPPIAGKVITLTIVVVMALNALLSMTVLVRYNTRKLSPESGNSLEELIDKQYPDERIVARWPNMIEAE